MDHARRELAARRRPGSPRARGRRSVVAVLGVAARRRRGTAPRAREQRHHDLCAAALRRVFRLVPLNGDSPRRPVRREALLTVQHGGEERCARQEREGGKSPVRIGKRRGRGGSMRTFRHENISSGRCHVQFHPPFALCLLDESEKKRIPAPPTRCCVRREQIRISTFFSTFVGVRAGNLILCTRNADDV